MPHVAVAVLFEARSMGRHFKKWEQSTARATGQRRWVLLGVDGVRNVMVTVWQERFTRPLVLCIIMWATQNIQYVWVCALCRIAYSLCSRHENKTLKWVWSCWASETDYEQRQRLWYIEWKSTIRNICTRTIILRRLTVPGTVLKPQLSIIPDLDRLCNNP